MSRPTDWLYGPSAAKRRRKRGLFVLAALCCLAACAVLASVRYMRDNGLIAPPRAAESPSTTEEETAPAAEQPSVKVKGLYVTAWSAGNRP